MPRHGRNVGAFSLIELLVVVGIISLLIAILVPALRRAREQGRRVVCGSHLRGLGTAWEIYTLDYGSPPQLARRGIDINWTCAPQPEGECRWERRHVGGFGPEYFDTYLTLNNEWQVWLSATHHRFHLFQVSNPPPPGPLPGHWWNWGLLWLGGTVQDPRIFFCPSMRDPDFAWRTPVNPWPPSLATMWRPDRPWQVNHTQASFERRIALTGVPWDRIPNTTALAHDIAPPNIESTAHREGANIAWRDGHVAFLCSGVFNSWWLPDDSWTKVDSQRRLLAFSYWMDRGGGNWPMEQAAR